MLRFLINGTVVVTAIGFLSCGAPLSPAASEWVSLASFNSGYWWFPPDTAVAAAGDTVFFPTGTEYQKDVIRRYRAGVVSTVYEVDRERGDVEITDMSISNGDGWAAGYRSWRINGTYVYRPFLIYYDSMKWEELDIPGEITGRFSAVAASAPKSCWLLWDDGTNDPDKNYTLYEYRNGDLAEFEEIKARAIAYDDFSKTIFAAVLKDDKLQVMVSANGGGEWSTETPAVELPDPYLQMQPHPVISAYSGELYILLGYGGPESHGGVAVLKRTGPAAAPVYDLLAFFTYMHGLSDIAASHRGLLGVGYNVSASFINGSWSYEFLPDKNTFYAVAAGASGFYALADNGMASNPRITELLFHP